MVLKITGVENPDGSGSSVEVRFLVARVIPCKICRDKIYEIK